MTKNLTQNANKSEDQYSLMKILLIWLVAGVPIWVLGYPDQAQRYTHQGLSLAQELAHPFTLAYAHHAAAEFGDRGRFGRNGTYGRHYDSRLAGFQRYQHRRYDGRYCRHYLPFRFPFCSPARRIQPYAEPDVIGIENYPGRHPRIHISIYGVGDG